MTNFKLHSQISFANTLKRSPWFLDFSRIAKPHFFVPEIFNNLKIFMLLIFCHNNIKISEKETRLRLIGDKNANYVWSKTEQRMNRKNCCMIQQCLGIAFMLRICLKYFKRASHDMYAILLLNDIFVYIARMLLWFFIN